MTTNQTIDGVRRELLVSLLAHIADGIPYRLTLISDIAELRTLLDAPVCGNCAGLERNVPCPDCKPAAMVDAPAPRAEFKKVEMAHVMNALEDVRGKPVLTSNQCHDLARALNDRLLSPLQLLAMPAEYLAAAQPQGEPVAFTAVGVLRDDGDGGLAPEWILEGGTSELWAGAILLIADEDQELCAEDGHCELYRVPVEQPAPVAVASRDESIGWLKRIDGIGQNRAELIYSMGFRRHTEVPQS